MTRSSEPRRVPAPASSSGTAQASPHRGERVELATRTGPVAALRAEGAGPSDWAAVAVLVPGYSGSKEDFAPLVDPIADAGIGVLAVDLPGQYESPGPDDELAYRPGPLGAVVAELVGAETRRGRRVLLLGHSYGGLVARAAVLAGARVRGLTLLGSGPGELPPGWRRRLLDAAEPVLRREGVAGALAMREQMDPPVPPVADPVVADLMRRRALASSVVALLGMGDALREEPDRVPELVAHLRTQRTGVLVVCGMDDDGWPVSVQRTMADRLDAEFAAVTGAAHAPNVENPDGLLDVLLPTWRSWLAE